MEKTTIPGWHGGIAEACQLQADLAAKIICRGTVKAPRFIAGCDLSAGRRGGGTARGAVVLLDYPGLRLVEKSVVSGELDFPYVPGLLSFRELPLLLQAFRSLSRRPDLLLVDGQGRAHPRRLGLACHLGLELGVPSVGCAKSRLCGEAAVPGNEPGDYSQLRDGREIIGAVLRTRTGVKPLYISVGHRLSLAQARHWTLACCRGYRLPEPTRLAHLAAGGNL